MGFILRFPAYLCLTNCFLMCYFTIAGRRLNAVERKMIVDLCSSNENISYVLSDSGVKSAVQFIAHQDFQSKKERNCTFIIDIDSGNSGVIVHVDSTYNTGTLYRQCDNYIQVSMPKGFENSSKLCGFKPSSIVLEGKAIFQYHEKHTLLPSREFTILATAYRKSYGNCYLNEFMCYTGECIWNGFLCDGMANCPDGSDEFETGRSFCIYSTFTLKPVKPFDHNKVIPTTEDISPYRKSSNVTVPIAIASAILIVLAGVVKFICQCVCAGRHAHLHQQQALRRPSVVRSSSNLELHVQLPQSSYITHTNANINSSSICDNPPPYSSELVSRSAHVALLNNTNKNVKQNHVFDPPPPYEP